MEENEKKNKERRVKGKRREVREYRKKMDNDMKEGRREGGGREGKETG